MKIFVFILLTWIICSCDTQSNSFQQKKNIEYPIVNDLDTAISLAETHSKDILVLFDCFNCLGDRLETKKILSEERFKRCIQEEYIFLVLYLDDKRELPQTNKSTKKTIGELNNNIQKSLINRSNIPSLLIIDTEMKILKEPIFLPASRDILYDYIYTK